MAYDLALARFYMWAQTEEQVFLAILVPTGGSHMLGTHKQATQRKDRPMTSAVRKFVAIKACMPMNLCPL